MQVPDKQAMLLCGSKQAFLDLARRLLLFYIVNYGIPKQETHQIMLLCFIFPPWLFTLPCGQMN